MRRIGATVSLILLLPLLAIVTSADAATGPNGLVAYQCTVEGGLDSGICVLDPNAPPGTEPTVVVSGDFAANPDWSPDGSKIVFDSFLSTNQPNIHVVNADGSGITRLSATPCCERDFQPVWSPDGSRIAFVSTRDGDGEYEIYVMGSEGELVGAPAVRLTNNPAAPFGQGIQDWQPAWSPDSTKLAFVSNRDPSNRDACDVYVMDAIDADGDGNGDNLTRLTFDNIFDCDLIGPAWSPTGAQIAFTSTRSADYEIWVMNADGTNLVNMTQFPGQDFDAGWSPDGTQVTFVSGRDGDYEIFSTPAPPVSSGFAAKFAAAAAPPVTQLTHNSTADVQPDWGVDTGGGTGPFTLTVALAGTGAGNVRSTTPAGITCGSDCTETYAAGTVVTLKATPARGSTFTGWSGACSGVGPCVVTMDADKSVTATFGSPSPGGFTLTVTKAGTGAGSVTSTPAGIACGADCSETYTAGTVVTLTAKASRGSTFSGWSGACSGTGACTVTMNASKSVTATFTKL